MPRRRRPSCRLQHGHDLRCGERIWRVGHGSTVHDHRVERRFAVLVRRATKTHGSVTAALHAREGLPLFAKAAAHLDGVQCGGACGQPLPSSSRRVGKAFCAQVLTTVVREAGCAEPITSEAKTHGRIIKTSEDAWQNNKNERAFGKEAIFLSSSLLKTRGHASENERPCLRLGSCFKSCRELQYLCTGSLNLNLPQADRRLLGPGVAPAFSHWAGSVPCSSAKPGRTLPLPVIRRASRHGRARCPLSLSGGGHDDLMATGTPPGERAAGHSAATGTHPMLAGPARSNQVQPPSSLPIIMISRRVQYKCC